MGVRGAALTSDNRFLVHGVSHADSRCVNVVMGGMLMMMKLSLMEA